MIFVERDKQMSGLSVATPYSRVYTSLSAHPNGSSKSLTFVWLCNLTV